MTDSVQAQLEAVLRGIEERVEHHKLCDTQRWVDATCDCDRSARVRAEQARTVERMIEAALRGADVYLGGQLSDHAWAAALRAGEEHQ